MEGLIEGKMVHYCFQAPWGQGLVHRPAIVVKVWNQETGCANLTVFPDWDNDGFIDRGLFWATSVGYSAEPQPNTWHWIEES